MRKTIATALVTASFVLPSIALAADNSAQLIPLYQQLVALLTQELSLLQAQKDQAGEPKIEIDSPSGKAPYTVLIHLPSLNGTEALDFGDGHSTGSNGCILNAGGYCDLAHDLVHTYLYPGSYSLTLFRHAAGAKESSPVAHSIVTVE